MNKGSIKNVKPIQDRIHTAAVHWVAENMNCTTAYVYSVVKGTNTNGRAGEIMEAYRTKYSELQKILS